MRYDCTTSFLRRSERVNRIRSLVSAKFPKNFHHYAFATTRNVHPKTLALQVASLRAFHQTLKRHQKHDENTSISPKDSIILLPTTCSGCGALSQLLHSDQAGFYSLQRKAVRAYLYHQRHSRLEASSGSELTSSEQSNSDTVKDDVVTKDLKTGSGQDAPESERNFTAQAKATRDKQGVIARSEIPPPPICDRCHNLIYQSEGVPIAHPSIQSIAETIAASPFHRNHIYHVIDAVDFPLSVIPKLFSSLSLVHQRSKNRRAKDPRWKSHGQDATVDFVVTRSDLLAPQRTQVNRMMPWFVTILRDTLGRFGDSIRLGNVHLVSAKRGWWTVGLKDELRKRGGANWMVGKANVGKSNLLEGLLPKGMSGLTAASIRDIENRTQLVVGSDAFTQSLPSIPLPPPQPLSLTPTLPLVSTLPGTTASPIRLPFVAGATSSSRGELIDLPGLDRSSISNSVKSSFQEHLVMVSRPEPRRRTIKPKQSLLIGGGLVRLTPIGAQSGAPAKSSIPLDAQDSNDDPRSHVDIMAYTFLPRRLSVHITKPKRAELSQLNKCEIPGIENIVTSESASKVRSAGIFELSTDVTEKRAKKVLDSGVKIDELFFRTYSTEILIEGVGWIELVASVRRGRRIDEVEWPIPRVEVFTPEGKFVASRRPLSLWSLLESDLPKSIKKRRRLGEKAKTTRIQKKIREAKERKTQKMKLKKEKAKEK